MGGETKVCPVCDSEIDADARRCDYCQTDLSLFDLDSGGTVEVTVPSSANIDDLLASITEGKEVKGDIFETIKSVAKDGPGDEGGSAAAEAAKFECPVCGATVDAAATSCPSCGAEFAEEVAAVFECPVCGATVDAAATACPSCGATFVAEVEVPAGPAAAARALPEAAPRAPTPAAVAAAREVGLRERLGKAQSAASRPAPPPSGPDRRSLYKELPRLVNDVKPMLLNARKIGVDIERPKRLINDAISAGKAREIDRAVGLVSEAKSALEVAFATAISSRVEALLSDVERAKAGGSEVAALEGILGEAIGLLEIRDFTGAADRLNDAREEFEKQAGGYHRAKEALRIAEALAEDCRAFNLDTREADRFARQGREALGRRDYDYAAQLGERARGAIMRVLPDFLNDEMKRARNKLLDLKVRGGDLTRPIGILKQASIHLKREEYGEAMRYLRMFRREAEGL